MKKFLMITAFLLLVGVLIAVTYHKVFIVRPFSKPPCRLGMVEKNYDVYGSGGVTEPRCHWQQPASGDAGKKCNSSSECRHDCRPTNEIVNELCPGFGSVPFNKPYKSCEGVYGYCTPRETYGGFKIEEPDFVHVEFTL